MKTIAHISTVHQPFDQRIFHRECSSLAGAGYDTHLLVQLTESYRKVNGVHIHSLGMLQRNTLGLHAGRRMRLLATAAARARRLRASVYHLHDPELIPLGLWLKATTGARVIFDCHEHNAAYLRQKRYLHPLLRRALAVGMESAEWLASRSFDAIVTADRGVAELYRGFGARKVVTIHNFPHLDLFLRQHAGDDRERPYDLVYHGSIPRYHLQVAFDVAEALRARGRRARWLFFGRCPELDWARDEAARRGFAADFTIDDNLLPHDQVAARVVQGKIGFIPLPDLPKFQHNIPTKLFEFMALMMPIVLSDLPPSRPFVGDGACAVMVPPDDPGAYAAAIMRLLDDPELRRTMGAEGRRRIERKYNWQHEASHLLELYANLVRT